MAQCQTHYQSLNLTQPAGGSFVLWSNFPRVSSAQHVFLVPLNYSASNVTSFYRDAQSTCLRRPPTYPAIHYSQLMLSIEHKPSRIKFASVPQHRRSDAIATTTKTTTATTAQRLAVDIYAPSRREQYSTRNTELKLVQLVQHSSSVLGERARIKTEKSTETEEFRAVCFRLEILAKPVRRPKLPRATTTTHTDAARRRGGQSTNHRQFGHGGVVGALRIFERTNERVGNTTTTARESAV